MSRVETTDRVPRRFSVPWMLVIIALVAALGALALPTQQAPANAAYAHDGQNYCDPADVTVDIGAGQQPTIEDDVILGTPGDDIIDGLAGDDIICGLGGDDRLVGGPGDDIVLGGPGLDHLQGDAGADHVRGGDGVDYVSGGEGPDELSGGPGDDLIDGDAGNDVLWGTDGDDTLRGGPGDDSLWGASGEDVLEGGNDDDVLYGGIGADRLNGQAGEDDLVGGPGDDILDGSDGNDTLRGNTGADTLNGGDNFDICNVGSANEGDTRGSCEAQQDDPIPPVANPVLPTEPIVAPDLPAEPTERILVTHTLLDPGDTGWLDLGEGTRQWVNGECRGRLEALNVPLVVKDFSEINALTNLSATNCDEIIARLDPNAVRPTPTPPPPPVASANGPLAYGAAPILDGELGWAELEGGQRVLLDAACTAELAADRPEEITNSSLADRAPVVTAEECTSFVANANAVANASVYNREFRLLSTPATANGWVDYRDGVKEYVDPNCRARIEAIGVPVTIANFAEVIEPIPNVDRYDCGELLAFLGAPGQLPEGGQFTTDGYRIIDPYGQEFVPYGVNVSAEYFISESWGSKTDEKIGVWAGDWGFNTLRLNVFCHRLCNVTGTPETTSQDIHDTISTYEGSGVVLIVDFHSADFPNLPTQDEVDQSTEYFRDLAERYADNPYVWFNPFNEPINECDAEGNGDGIENLIEGEANSVWIDMHQPVLDAIRGSGSLNMVTLTASNFGQDRCVNQSGPAVLAESSIRRFGPTLMSHYDNLVFDLHWYSRWNTATPASIDQYFGELRSRGIPVFVGELGGKPDGFARQRNDYAAALSFFAHAPENIGVVAWHSSFGYPLVTDPHANAFVIDATLGMPTNLTDIGRLLWEHGH